MNRFVYFVRTVPGGRPLQLPQTSLEIQQLYWTTIQKLTGLLPGEARIMLDRGDRIETDGLEFYAVPMYAPRLTLVKSS